MKRYSVLALICAASLAPPVAWGATYSDLDTFIGGSGVGQVVNNSTPLNGSFNFVAGDGGVGDTAGYNPATETVTAFELAFQLFDGTSLQTVFINLDGVVIPTSFSGSITFGGTIPANFVTPILDASQDGVLPYTLSAPSGSEYTVNYALMRITTAPKGGGGGVPEGGSTVALLAAALGGLGLARRKLAR